MSRTRTIKTKGERVLRGLERYLTDRLTSYAKLKNLDDYKGKLDVAFIELDFDRHKIIDYLA